ncbi:MAG: apolipoprotein N-acyltransferase [Proteobacteria bacterium]|nr:apolipoprotein N-acyltransferase [Ramlibacter sp.]MCA0214457.1 apolipoprotein N-acyltransferase [Pseudomonadota bacterium]
MAWPLADVPGAQAGQPLWWLQLLSLAGLAWVVQRQPSWRRAALLGWLFATAWLTGTFWWLFVSMHTYGGLAAPLAALAVLALAAFLALYYAAACAAWVALGWMGPVRGATVFAALWTLAELARGNWFTGFPWGAGGYAHTDGLLAGYAPWLGVYGLGAVAAWLAMSLARVQACGRLQRVAVLALLTLPSVMQMGGSAHTASTGGLQVALLQGNVPQDEKFQPGTGVPLALRWYGEQLRDARAALVVAPETAVPMLPQQLPAGYWSALEQRFATGSQAALVGIPLGSFKDGYTNSVIGLRPGAPVYRFDKHHLVPFGEFIPPLFKWFTDLMNIPLGDFNRGEVGQPSFEWQGQQLAPNICYEDLFGEELGARFAGATPAPTMFVNVSNIGWFGNTVAIDQHLQISRMRALEFERPMIRATNTGATVIIDHRGVVTHSLARHTRGVLTGVVEGRTGATPFARWVSRLGLWPLWAFGLLVVGWAAWSARRRR